MSPLPDPMDSRALPPCTAEEARSLTERIRAQVEALCFLVAEARDRGAWRALGYASFSPARRLTHGSVGQRRRSRR